jgi:hypothetical protein
MPAAVQRRDQRGAVRRDRQVRSRLGHPRHHRLDRLQPHREQERRRRLDRQLVRAENLERHGLVVLALEVARRVAPDFELEAGKCCAISLRSSGANVLAPMSRAISSCRMYQRPRRHCPKIAAGRRPKSQPITTSTPGIGASGCFATYTAREKSFSTGLPSRRGDTRLSTFASIQDLRLPRIALR